MELPPAWGIKDVISQPELSLLSLAHLGLIFPLSSLSLSHKPALALKFSQTHNEEEKHPVSFKQQNL